MQNMTSDVVYRERLSPSLRTLVAAAVCAPMVALALSPVDTTIALVAGAAVAALIIWALMASAPRVEVSEGELRAGRAHIPVDLLGAPVAYTGEDARFARGRDADPRSWMLVRGGIGGAVVIPVEDADDPTPAWVVSSRTPDRLAAAVRRAQVRQRTPRR
ncbi:hypothetical protein GCM10027058_23620 [Microbacterium neimengense]